MFYPKQNISCYLVHSLQSNLDFILLYTLAIKK